MTEHNRKNHWVNYTSRKWLSSLKWLSTITKMVEHYRMNGWVHCSNRKWLSSLKWLSTVAKMAEQYRKNGWVHCSNRKWLSSLKQLSNDVAKWLTKNSKIAYALSKMAERTKKNDWVTRGRDRARSVGSIGAWLGQRGAGSTRPRGASRLWPAWSRSRAWSAVAGLVA
jgi:hypothetical protein